jgi:plasmid stability protein
MASLSVRKLDNSVYDKLRLRAAKHGVSMEEEARRILSQAVSAPEKISAVFLKYFGDKNGVNLDIPDQRTPHEAMDFHK